MVEGKGFLPSATNFRPGYRSVAQEVLQTHHTPHLDMTTCVGRVPPAQRFVTIHYSPSTNAAVARCLRDALGELPAFAAPRR
jgi:hypothetical protein